MYCGNCGAEVKDSQKFCHACGAPMSYIDENVNCRVEQNVINNSKMGNYSDECVQSKDEARLVVKAIYSRLIRTMVGMVFSLLHLFLILFSLFIWKSNLIIELLGLLGLVTAIVFVGFKRIFSMSKNIITLGGSIAFTIYGIPLMIGLFLLCVVAILYIPIIGMIVAYREGKEDFWDTMDMLDADEEIVDDKLQKSVIILRIVMAILIVACVIALIVGIGKKMNSSVASMEATYETSDELVEMTGEDDTDKIKKASESKEESIWGEAAEIREKSGNTDGFKWNAVEDGIEITGYDGSENSVIDIPAMIGEYSVTSIGEYAFSGLKYVEEVNIPSTVVSIGEYAFEYDTNLLKVDIKNGLKVISHCAFSGCSNLQYIELPDSLEEIGKSSFRGTALEKIVIPANVKLIGNAAFNECENLKEIVLNEGLEIIGDEAFRKTAVEKITIPSSVSEIGNSAFLDASNLTDVVIVDGDIDGIIDEKAFWETGIKSITVPGRIVKMKDLALGDTLEEVFWLKNENGKDQEIEGSQFFYMNNNPINIHVSESLTKIGKLHDTSWGDTVTLYGPEGCYAQKYAEESEGKYSFVAE